jgi:hypothetical protein
MPSAAGLIRRAPVAWYAALAAVTASPMARGGHLLLLDFALVRRVTVQWWPTLASPGPENAAPASGVLWLLVHLGPLGAPLLIFSLFFAAGMGMHRLVTTLLAPASRAPAFFAGTLYAVNPFVYERLMAGHLYLLAAYAIAPFLIVSAVRFVREPGARTATSLAAFTVAIAWTSLHYLVMALFLVLACVGLRRETYRAPVFRWSAVAAAIVLAANAWWIAGLAFVRAGELVTTSDLNIYATAPRSNRVIGFVTALYGFWRHEWRLPRDGVRGWWVLFVIIAVLVLYGVVVGARNRAVRPLGIGLALLIPIAVVLACGTSFSPTRGLFLWLFAHVPGFHIFREPEKWVALLPFAYAVLGAIGLDRLFSRSGARGWDARAFIAVALIVPLVYGNTLLWNWGRLRPVRFPSEWTTADRLIVDRGGGRMLFLPWHLYISLSFTGYRVTNPASSFFSVPVLAGDNVEVGAIRTQSVNPDSKAVTSLISDPRDQARAAEILASMCVRWVVLAKEDDFALYKWLSNAPSLEKVGDNSHLEIWMDSLTPVPCNRAVSR